mmetsp:Transcript_36609/g.87875  ORF Transcript_36609/g.87875 Transcript_36609/m.87875 type:complete len:230 (-) Transcript_36609:503-1192(-)
MSRSRRSCVPSAASVTSRPSSSEIVTCVTSAVTSSPRCLVGSRRASCSTLVSHASVTPSRPSGTRGTSLFLTTRPSAADRCFIAVLICPDTLAKRRRRINRRMSSPAFLRRSCASTAASARFARTRWALRSRSLVWIEAAATISGSKDTSRALRCLVAARWSAIVCTFLDLAAAASAAEIGTSGLMGGKTAANSSPALYSSGTRRVNSRPSGRRTSSFRSASRLPGHTK